MKTLQAVMIMVALMLVVGAGHLVADPAWDPGLSISRPEDQTRVTRLWTGFISPMWNNANNWTPIGIPSPADDVVIPAALTMPMINSPGAYCHSLVNNVGMILMITPPGTLHVFGQVDNYGNIDMHNVMIVDTHLIMHPGSYLATSNPAAQLTVNGNCALDTDSTIMMNAGTFIMSGSGPGVLTNNGDNCSFFDVFLNKTGSNVTFSNVSSTPVFVAGSLTVGGSTTCSVQMTPALLLAGNLLVNSGGNFYGQQGEVCCNGGGTIYQTVNFTNTDSYFNHLRILGGVALSNNIRINGNIYLDGGNFAPGMFTVYLKGYWYNNVGPSAFTKGSSRVTFNGPSAQSIVLSMTSTIRVEYFHILEVNKSGGSALLLDQPGQSVVCDAYDWSAGSVTVVDGTLTINSLADVCITGKFVVHSNGSVSITSTGSVSFDCDLYIYGGTVHIFGGTTDSQWPGSSPGSITMNDGLLYFHDVGVVVNNLFAFTENISGGTIRVNGGFYIGRPDFHPSGGTIEFVGSNPATIGMVDGACFYNVLVDKAVPPPPAPVLREPSRDTTLYSVSDLDIQGSLGVESGSGLDLDHYADVYGPATVSGSVWVRVSGDTGNPSLDLHNGVDIEIGSHWVLVAFVWVKVEGPVPYPAQDVDGEIVIEEDAKWESCSVPMNVGPTGSIVFVAGGGGGIGGVRCPGFSATYPGTFVSPVGTLELTGSADGPRYLNLASGNHCCNLLINSLGPIVLQNDCDILGDLDILQGSLDASTANFDINLHGSWTDEMAPTGFEARNGTVSFLGSGSSDIDAGGAEESFFDVIINKSGGTVTAYGINGTLHVCGDLDVHIDSFFDVYTEIEVDGDLDLWGDLRDNDCDIAIHGYPHLAAGSELRILGTDGRVLCDAPSLALPPLNIAGYVWIQDGTLEVTHMPVSVASSGNVYFFCGGGGSGGRIKCPSFQALTPGTFVPDCGTLELTSTAPTSTHFLNIGPGNHTHDLLINDWLVVLQNDCDIYGDLHIQQGILDVSPSNYAINLRGSWTNDVAPAGFEARNGTVTMLGSGNAYINAGGLREEYYNLNIAKSGGGVYCNCELEVDGDLDIMPDSFFDVFFDVLVDGDLDLLGDLHCSVPLTLTLHGRLFSAAGSQLLLGDGLLHCDNADLPRTTEILGTVVLGGGSCAFDHHHLTILSSGAIVISGGGGAGGNVGCTGLTALTPGSFVPSRGILRLTGDPDGVLEHLNLASGNHCCGLTIDAISPVQLDNDCDVLGDLHILQGTLDVSTADRLLRVGGNWVNDNPSLGFEARNGTVIFGGGGGGGACSISAGGLREEFHNLVIDKALSTDTVTLDDHVCTLGDGVCDIIRGTLYVNDHELTVSGNCNIAGGGILFLDGGTCAMGDGRILTVNSGGTCKAHGNRNRESRMKGKENTGRWKLKVNSGGHISAKQTEFKHLREEGVKVYPGGIIDPDGDFDECRFNSGAAGCTFLTLDNSQALTIDAIEFVSGSSEQYNIAKLENAGHILVESCSGNFTGPLHELDPHGRIDWVGFDPNLVISGFEVSDPDPMYPDLISYTVHVLNDSDYPVTSPFNLHLFLNRDLPPELYEAGDLVHSCGPLPGHGVCSHTFTDVGYLPPDIWHSWAFADPENVILEEEEMDNLAGPLTVTWRPLPNLVVTEFTASDYDPVVGTPVNLHVEVTNQSPTTIEVDCIMIRIYDPVTGELIHEECVPVDDGLLGFGVLELDVSHTRYAPLTELLAVWADPLNAIPESNESDNQAELPQPIVWSGLPDLVVVSFIPSDPDPYVADLISYNVTILNDSDTPILTPFTVHFFKNRPTQPGWGEFGDLLHSCGPMLPHASYSFSFDNLYSMEPEIWNSHLLIDPEGVIHESEEFNNHQQGLIQYHPLDQPQTFIMPLRSVGRYNQARIAWNYPLWVSRFKIYASDDPEGDFILIDWTVDSFFDVYLDAPRLFYRVTAERDAPPE